MQEHKITAEKILVIDDWNELIAIELPQSPNHVIYTCLITAEHREAIEIRISAFDRKQSTFTECSSKSWTCCTNSDLTQQVESSIHSFLSTHLREGKWINFGKKPTTIGSLAREQEQKEEGDLAAHLTEKTVLGKSFLATEAYKQSGESLARLNKELSELRDRLPGTLDRASSFDELTGLLTKYNNKRSSPVAWRAEFTCVCVDVIRRREAISVHTTPCAHQRRKELAAVTLNKVVSELVPHLGAHALVLLMALEAASFNPFKLHKIGSNDQQAFAKMAAKKLLNISIQASRDELWFHPAALIAWFMKDRYVDPDGHAQDRELTLCSYSNICKALGMDNLADSELDRHLADGEVPWGTSLRGLFESKPGPEGCVERRGCNVIISPQPSHLPDDMNSADSGDEEVPGTPNNYESQALQQKRRRIEISDGVGEKDERNGTDSRGGKDPGTPSDCEAQAPKQKRRKIGTSDDIARDTWQGASHISQEPLLSTGSTMAPHSATSSSDAFAVLVQVASQSLLDNRGRGAMNMDQGSDMMNQSNITDEDACAAYGATRAFGDEVRMTWLGGSVLPPTEFGVFGEENLGLSMDSLFDENDWERYTLPI
ncbi:hypothetical protein VM1G_10396 [Cytospora mali]|uniref:Uncharacterized protein n=1 Tax=Cytospora mali TaxID=578113 RepID=A0A194VH35_CYTMA|nr:hypothetical protein VM1G_10396 [Valsa mali]